MSAVSNTATVMNRHQFLFLPALIVLMLSGQQMPRESVAFGSILPESLGEYRRTGVSAGAGSVASADQKLLQEYGLLEADHAVYVSCAGRELDAEVFQFPTSERG